jgi:endo-1,3-1,4-beta-glycanase ExoK
VKFIAGGMVLRNWTKDIALLKLPQNILLTIWASATASRAGPLTATPAPASAEIDGIRVYPWKG